MSNVNRKAKGTTLVDKKLTKANERIQQLGQQVNAARMQVLNMRQMYEAVVQEKQMLQQRLDTATQIIVGAALQTRKKQLVLTEKTLTALSSFVGYELDDPKDGSLVVLPITQEQFESDFEDDEVENEDE